MEIGAAQLDGFTVGKWKGFPGLLDAVNTLRGRLGDRW